MPTPEQVAEFLKQNPGFFENHVEILVGLHIPHPHGGRAVSIGERQLVAVREKAKLLEEKLRELIQFGEENDAVSEKVHRLACRLIESTSLDAALDTLYLDLLDHFAVPHVAVRLWNVAEENPETKEFGAVATEMRGFVAQMTVPFCGHHAVYESQAWFGESAPHLKSFALIALTRDGLNFGAIALASEDPKRFYAEMGTLYLQRIGEPMSHVLWRFVTPVRGETACSALERYLAHLRNERRLSGHTLAAYQRDCALLLELAGGRAFVELTAHDIRRFIATLHGKGLAPRSLARTLSSWRGFFDWLARARELPANPCVGVRAPKAARRLPEALSPDDAVRLVALQDDSDLGIRDSALFELAYSCGLRVSELTDLDIGAVDRRTGEARVTGKGSKTRIVPVGEPALTAIAKWLPVRAALAKPGEDALFVGPRGHRMTPREVQKRIKLRAAAAGLDVDVHPHMLRHSFASHVLQSSGDLRAVQEMLGHASIASTQVYTHLDFQHLAKVYDSAHPRARRKKAKPTP